MKDLKLKKEPKNKGFIYKVYENDTLLCQRQSNREYVACYVVYQPIIKDGNTVYEYNAPFFFSRLDLIGKGDSRRFNSPDWKDVADGIALLDY